MLPTCSVYGSHSIHPCTWQVWHNNGYDWNRQQNLSKHKAEDNTHDRWTALFGRAYFNGQPMFGMDQSSAPWIIVSTGNNQNTIGQHSLLICQPTHPRCLLISMAPSSSAIISAYASKTLITSSMSLLGCGSSDFSNRREMNARPASEDPILVNFESRPGMQVFRGFVSKIQLVALVRPRRC